MQRRRELKMIKRPGHEATRARPIERLNVGGYLFMRISIFVTGECDAAGVDRGVGHGVLDR